MLNTSQSAQVGQNRFDNLSFLSYAVRKCVCVVCVRFLAGGNLFILKEKKSDPIPSPQKVMVVPSHGSAFLVCLHIC